MKLIGPFKQILTLNNLPLRGKISDEQLEIIENGGILINSENIIEAIGDFDVIASETNQSVEIEKIDTDKVCLPAFVDCHTHICFGGNRANDFAMRNAGKTYLEIAEKGGGIWSSVQHTRNASEKELLENFYHLFYTITSDIHADIKTKLTQLIYQQEKTQWILQFLRADLKVLLRLNYLPA